MIIEKNNWIYIKLIILFLISTSIKIPVKYLGLFKNYIFNSIIIIILFNFTKDLKLTGLYYLIYLLVILIINRNNKENFEATLSNLRRNFNENTDLSPEQAVRKRQQEVDKIGSLKKDLESKKKLLVIAEKFDDFADKMAEQEVKNLEYQRKKLENLTGYLKTNQEKVVALAVESEKNANQNAEDSGERVNALKLSIESIESNLETSNDLKKSYEDIEIQDLEEDERKLKKELKLLDIQTLYHSHLSLSRNNREAYKTLEDISKKIIAQISENNNMLNNIKGHIKDVNNTDENEFLDYLNSLEREESSKAQSLTIYSKNLINKITYFKNKSYFDLVTSRIYKILTYQFDSSVNADKKKKLSNDFKENSFNTLYKIQALQDQNELHERYLKTSEEISTLYGFVRDASKTSKKEVIEMLDEITKDLDKQDELIKEKIKNSSERKNNLVKEVKSDKQKVAMNVLELKNLYNDQKYEFLVFEEIVEEDISSTYKPVEEENILPSSNNETADISLEETDNSYIEEENVYPKKNKRKVCSPPAFYSMPKYKSAISDEVHHEFYDYPTI